MFLGRKCSIVQPQQLKSLNLWCLVCEYEFIGGNYSECLLGYIKLLTSTNKYYTLGCCESCVPTLSRLSEVS